MICLDTPEQIDGARMLVLRSGLKVELIGMRLTRGRTCYSMIKEEFNLKGNKEKVLKDFEEILRANNILT
tara:strand:+ start:128 stop:337 length:210 start_codon:yes stop_codon:yes gene_type:complete